MAAALRVFSRRGSELRIREVAAEMGVSPATVYGYVTGKEALLFWMTRQALDPKPVPPAALPVDAPPADRARREIARLAREVLHLSRLDDRRWEATADPAAELVAILEEIYAGTERTGELVAGVIADVRRDPAGAGRFFGDLRRRLLDGLRHYIEARVADGSFAPVPDSEAAAHLVIQVSAWFGRDRRGDPEGARIPDELARATATRLLARALLAERAP
jgi:AcrR family transcriptional regulator